MVDWTYTRYARKLRADCRVLIHVRRISKQWRLEATTTKLLIALSKTSPHLTSRRKTHLFCSINQRLVVHEASLPAVMHMELIRTRAFARAGLVGNPSDGYGGRTISVIVKNFSAEVVLYEWEDLEIILSQDDRSRFDSIGELQHDVKLHGYYGGVRLVKATIKRFAEYCAFKNIKLHDRNFSIRYQSTIPRAVGLAGSSAIIVATLRALLQFYQIDIPLEVQPSLALSVETGELGIAGGLQDRVIQIFEGVVFMDFAAEHSKEIDGLSCGHYESLNPNNLPPLYIAFSSEAGEPTEVLHAPLRARFNQGDVNVINAMHEFARIADESKAALQKGDAMRFHSLIDENFNLRNSICDLSANHVAMIETARSVGASAKFAGSGGAIIGTFPAGRFDELTASLKAIGCEVIRPLM
jgi:glucuronokinase